jgi:hypothetical protein
MTMADGTGTSIDLHQGRHLPSGYREQWDDTGE